MDADGVGRNAGSKLADNFLDTGVDVRAIERREPGIDDTQQPVEPGETGELILTSLGRAAWPVIRYRTGDVVRPVRESIDGGTSRLWLEGGILGRADDMVTIRAVNVFPSAIENLIREVAGTAEFRVKATRRDETDDLDIDLEGDEKVCSSVAQRIREIIGIRVDVTAAELGSLPRWEGKSKRFVDLRDSG